jgi:hypothetical protein
MVLGFHFHLLLIVDKLGTLFSVKVEGVEVLLGQKVGSGEVKLEWGVSHCAQTIMQALVT